MAPRWQRWLMPDIRATLRLALEEHLRCPSCGQCNRPGVLYIHLDESGRRACCDTCSAEDDVLRFQPWTTPEE